MISELTCPSEHFVLQLLAQSANAPVVRAVVRIKLDGYCPRVGDLLVVAGEFVADAVRGPGSHFGVIVDAAPGRVRIEVEAEAGDGDSGEFLFGMALIEGHADRWGRYRCDGRGIWWAELFWEEPPTETDP